MVYRQDASCLLKVQMELFTNLSCAQILLHEM